MISAATPDYRFKICLIGESGVGKTTFAHKGCGIDLIPGSISSCGFWKTISVGDRKIKLEFWDTAGQERYRALAPMYFRGADAVILCYSITDRDSFEQIDHWFKMAIQHSNKSSLIFLIGNKIDLEESRTVTSEEGFSFAQDRKMNFKEISAKLGSGIEELLLEIAAKLKDYYDTNLNKEQNHTLPIQNKPTNTPKCC